MSSCRSGLTAGNFSEVAAGVRSDDCPEGLGGGISRDKRPLSTSLSLAVRSILSRAESAVHRGGGSGRTRSRSGAGILSEDRPNSLDAISGARLSVPGKSRGLSPGLSPSLSLGRSPGLPLGRSNLGSWRRESRPSLLSPWRGCLSSKSRLGNGASGRLGRLGLPLSSSDVGGAFLPISGRDGTFAGVDCNAFAALNRSRSASTSIFFDSMAAAGGSGRFVIRAFSVESLDFVAAREVFASSTSPSSTSAGPGTLGVETPWELLYVSKVIQYGVVWTNLAREPGLNSGAVGFKRDFAADLPPSWLAFAESFWEVISQVTEVEGLSTYCKVSHRTNVTKCLHHDPFWFSLL